MKEALGHFGNLKITERDPSIELNPVYPLSVFRDDQQTSSSGAVTSTASEYRIRHQASGDFAALRSSERGRYLPGNSAEVGVAIRMDTDPSTLSGDLDAKWGYFDMELDGSNNNKETIKNGVVFGSDSSGFYVQLIKEGTEEFKKYENEFNINSSEGVDITKGDIFEIDINYYGYGLIIFSLVTGSSGDKRQDLIPLHSYKPSGQTSLGNVNLQIGGLVKSSNESSDVSMYMGGRQFAVNGKFKPKTRVTDETVEGVTVGTTGLTPLMSFRRKATRREASIGIYSMTALSDSDSKIEVYITNSLTNANFGSLSNRSDSETAMEVDTSATALSGGEKVYSELISGGSTGNRSNTISTQDLPQSIPDEAIITFAASAIDAEATFDFIGRVKEEF